MLSYIICSVQYYCWLYDSESEHGPIFLGGYSGSDKKAQDGLVKFQAAKTSSS